VPYPALVCLMAQLRISSWRSEPWITCFCVG